MNTRSFDIKTGLTVQASSASLAFLWTNWDVCDQLNNRALRIRRLSSDSWSGKGWGAAGEWHLMKAEFTVHQGRFEFLAFGRFLGSSFRSQVTFEYGRLDGVTLSYVGKGTLVFTSRIAPLGWFIEICGTRGASYGNQVGARLAELITKQPELVREHSGDAAWHTYKDFMDEEAALRNGTSPQLHHFAEHLIAQREPKEGTEVEILTRKLEDLDKKISAISAELNISDYYSSLGCFSSDPRMPLVKNRTIVEHIAGIIYLRELRQPSGTRRLDQLIETIAKQKSIPENIVALMRTVQYLGNLSAHAESVDRVRSSINAFEFSVSFNATLRITEWFFSEYHDSFTSQPGSSANVRSSPP